MDTNLLILLVAVVAVIALIAIVVIARIAIEDAAATNAATETDADRCAAARSAHAALPNPYGHRRPPRCTAAV